MVTIEEGDEERSIVTPDMRLRFHWLGDRWTHSIDLRPGPWQTAAQVVEPTAQDSCEAIGPTFQEVHFQPEGETVLALAVGQAGPHHYSAAFRVSFRAYRTRHDQDDHIIQDRSYSCVEIDIADRCRARSEAPVVEYMVHGRPLIVSFLGDSDDADAPDGYSRDWKPSLVWETSVECSYDVSLSARAGWPVARVAIVDVMENGLRVRATADRPESESTSRLIYSWGHERVNAFRTLADSPSAPPWSLQGAPSPLIS